MAVWSTVRLSALAAGLRCDAEYYQPRYLADAARLTATKPVRIDDFAYVTDGIHASPDEVEAEDAGVLYLSAKCVKDNYFTLGDALYISRAQHDANPRTSLRAEDVLLTTVGTIGNAAVVQPEILPANVDRHLGIIRLRPDAPVNAYYLALFLNCEFGRFQSQRDATGNVQLNLFIEKIKELRVPILRAAGRLSERVKAAYSERRGADAALDAAQSLLVEALKLERVDLSADKYYATRFRDLQAGRRFGAEYYMPCKKRVLAALARTATGSIRDYATPARDLWDPSRAPKGQLARNFDVTDALEPFLDDSKEPAEAGDIGSVKKQLRAGDVVISRLRSYLREIAIVRTNDTPLPVGSSEFVVLRPLEKRLSAESLMVFLRCPAVQTVLRWSQDGSNHPRFAEDDLLNIPVPDSLRDAQAEVDGLVRRVVEGRRRASRLMSEAKREIEHSIAHANQASPA